MLMVNLGMLGLLRFILYNLISHCFSSLFGLQCVLQRICTIRWRFGDRSALGSAPSPSQQDRARTRFSTKIGSITNNHIAAGHTLPRGLT